MVIIFLGPPGSGKGTQASRLSRDLSLLHISTGDLFRENITQNTSLGKKAKSYMDEGQLVPDEIVNEMIFERINRSDARKGVILDGFPRKVSQAEALKEQLRSNDPLLVLNLDVDDSEILRRLSGRLQCKECGNIQHREFSPPAKEGVCDRCSGELYQREDDQDEVIQKRLAVYHEQTQPLIAYYEKQGYLVTINGQMSPEDVYNALREKVPAN